MKTDCEKPAPKIHLHRGYYSAIKKSLLITIPAGIIDFSWVPDSCRSNYHMDGCYFEGCFTLCEDIVYADGHPIETAAERQILLPLDSGGWLAFRALSALDINLEYLAINIEPITESACGL
jgi:hypothetical protein